MGIANDFNDIALANIEQETYDEAEDANMRALGIRQDLGDKLGVAECFKNYGIIYS